jgi:hypothetical protein
LAIASCQHGVFYQFICRLRHLLQEGEAGAEAIKRSGHHPALRYQKIVFLPQRLQFGILGGAGRAI